MQALRRCAQRARDNIYLLVAVNREWPPLYRSLSHEPISQRKFLLALLLGACKGTCPRKARTISVANVKGSAEQWNTR